MVRNSLIEFKIKEGFKFKEGSSSGCVAGKGERVAGKVAA